MKKSLSRLFAGLVVVSVLIYSGCTSEEGPGPVDCSKSGLVLTIDNEVDPTSCATPNGKIEVVATGGTAPYQFALNGGTFVSLGEFEDLTAGTYEVTVKDKNGCEATVEATLTQVGSDLNATVTPTTNTGCGTANGQISIAATGGTAPYQYKLDGGSYGSTSTFTALTGDAYVVSVKDNAGCVVTVNVTVNNNSGLKYNSEIRDIFVSRCSTPTCHGGSQNPNLTTLSAIQTNKAGIRSRVSSGNMPKNNETNMTEQERQKVICWIDDGAKNN